MSVLCGGSILATETLSVVSFVKRLLSRDGGLLGSRDDTRYSSSARISCFNVR